jgi:hypothetical protein
MWTRLLPALLPSWRFFDAVGPSPRIEIRWRNSPAAAPGKWLAWRPRPVRLPAIRMLGRLVWNPAWNETLFQVRCAERMLEGDLEFPRREIERCLRRGLRDSDAGSFQYRVLALRRRGPRVHAKVMFLSDWLAPTDLVA